MTTQLKPPEQQAIPVESNILEPAPPRSSSLWRLLKCPLLLISVLIHGALLTLPGPSERQAKEPEIEETPVTKTVSLKRPVPKPQRQSQPKPKPQVRPPQPTQALQPVPRPRPVPQAAPPTPEVVKPKEIEPEEVETKESESPEAEARESDPKSKEAPETPSGGADDPNAESKDENSVPIDNEEVESVFGELDQALINTEVESEFDYIPEPSEFPEPEKFFTPDSIAAFDLSSNPNLVASGGIINSPRYYRLKDPDEVLASLPTLTAFQNAEEPKQIGEYGGGPVYEVEAGEKTYYVNLVKAKSIGKATFVIFWKWDPNNPPQQQASL